MKIKKENHASELITWIRNTTKPKWSDQIWVDTTHVFKSTWNWVQQNLIMEEMISFNFRTYLVIYSFYLFMYFSSLFLYISLSLLFSPYTSLRHSWILCLFYFFIKCSFSLSFLYFFFFLFLSLLSFFCLFIIFYVSFFISTFLYIAFISFNFSIIFSLSLPLKRNVH